MHRCHEAAGPLLHPIELAAQVPHMHVTLLAEVAGNSHFSSKVTMAGRISSVATLAANRIAAMKTATVW